MLTLAVVIAGLAILGLLMLVGTWLFGGVMYLVLQPVMAVATWGQNALTAWRRWRTRDRA